MLYKIASDIFITRYRRGVVEQNYSKNITLDIERNTPEEQLQYEETLKKYNTTLTKLTDKQRTIFLMSRNEDLKYKEIAERLNISIKSVEKHITKALSHFKKVFNK